MSEKNRALDPDKNELFSLGSEGDSSSTMPEDLTALFSGPVELPPTLMSPVLGGLELPASTSEIGGIVLDLVGLNGVRITLQLRPSDLYFGPTEASTFLGGTELSPTLVDRLGGGLSEAAVRLTLWDANAAAARSDDDFDVGDLELLVNGVAVGSLSEVTTFVSGGETSGNSGKGFGSGDLATGFVHITQEEQLKAIFVNLAEGTAFFNLNDADPEDNVVDFRTGLSEDDLSSGHGPLISAFIEGVRIDPDFVDEGDLVKLDVIAQDYQNPEGDVRYAFDIDGDGVPDETNTTGSIKVQYDDNGEFVVNVKVSGGEGPATKLSAPISVRNVAPSVSVEEVEPVVPGGSATLAATIVDPGLSDTYQVVVTWGDGSSLRFELGSSLTGSQRFTVDHTFGSDADPGIFEATVAVTDSDGGRGIGVTTIEVLPFEPENSAPTIRLDAIGAVDENGRTIVEGTVSDADLEGNVEVTIDWGDGKTSTTEVRTDAEGAGRFRLGHVYTDNPEGEGPGFLVRASVTDSSGATAGAERLARVANVDPTITLDPVEPVTPGSVTTLTGIVEDPGVLDTFDVVVDWGDGTLDRFELGASETGSQSFSVDHVYSPGLEPGFVPIEVSVMDDDGGRDSAATRVEVISNIDNTAPEISLEPILSADEGGNVFVFGRVSDADLEDELTVTVLWGDGTTETVVVLLDAETGSGAFSLSHLFTDDPEDGRGYLVSATVTDGSGARDTVEGVAVVSNVGPTVRLDKVASVMAGGTVTLSGTVEDPGVEDTFQLVVVWGDGTPDTFELGASATGRQPFSLQHTFAADIEPGDFTITVTVSDDDDARGSASTVATVLPTEDNEAPVIKLDSLSAIDEGMKTVLTGTVSDADLEDKLTVTVVWGDGLSESVVVKLDGETGEGSFAITHLFEDDPEGDRGRYIVSATVTDGAGASATEAEKIKVNNVAPVLTLSAIKPVVVGDEVKLKGTLVDPGLSDSFEVVVGWGDGTEETFELGASDDGSQDFTFKHTYSKDLKPGDVAISVSVKDGDGGRDNAETTVEVRTTDENRAPTITLDALDTIVEGGTAVLNGTVRDADLEDDVSVRIAWGDGAVEDVTVTLDEETGTGTFTLSHVYVDDPEGSKPRFEIQATATDEAGDSGVARRKVAVENAAPTLFLEGLDPVVQGEVLTLRGAISDPGARDTFELQITWGDGTSETIELPAASTGLSRLFSIEHTYSREVDPGNLVVEVVVRDGDGGIDTKTTGVELLKANSAPEITLETIAAIDENGEAVLKGVVSDVDLGETLTLDVVWGDGSSETVTLTPDATGTRAFTLSHVYLDNADRGGDGFTVSASVTDSSGESASAERLARVNNVAPGFASIIKANVPGDGTATVGTNISLAGGFFDEGLLDEHRVIIDWDDGTVFDTDANPGAFSTFIAGEGGGRFAASHSYKAGGIYDIEVRLIDDDGAERTINDTVLVSGIRLDGGSSEIEVVAPKDGADILFFTEAAAVNSGEARLMLDASGVRNIVAATNFATEPLRTFEGSGVTTITFVGSAAADTVDLGAMTQVTATMDGGGGGDFMRGGALADSIFGAMGADDIMGQGGQDTIKGGLGNDRLFGDFDHPGQVTSAFADTVEGGGGRDTVSGGGGDDELDGGFAADVVAGGYGNDLVEGGKGSDLLFGDEAAYVDESLEDPLAVTSAGTLRYASTGDVIPQAVKDAGGSDTILGGAGNDVIYGQFGQDEIDGGAGNDTIDPGRGRDIIFTRSGSDIIIFRGGDGVDTVMDFNVRGGDVLDLREYNRPAVIKTVGDVLASARQDGDDVVFDLWGPDSIRLKDIALTDLSQDDVWV